MSLSLAAGWSFDSDQSVSVVPMIQWLPHGMTKRTDVSVRRISPELERIRSRGTTRWMPLLARTWNCPRCPASSWVSSVQTPVALTTWRARTSITRSDSRSWTRAPTTRSPSLSSSTTRAREATCAP